MNEPSTSAELPARRRSVRASRERIKTAERVRRWREQHAGTPENRIVDAAISEALALYAQSLTPAECKALMTAVTTSATHGLQYRGYEKAAVRAAIKKRMETWISSTLHAGCVRAAKLQREVEADVTRNRNA